MLSTTSILYKIPETFSSCQRSLLDALSYIPLPFCQYLQILRVHVAKCPAPPSAATVPAGLIDCFSSLQAHPSADHQSVLSKTRTLEVEMLYVRFPKFAAFSSELLERIWQLTLPDYQNVVIIRGLLRKDLRLAWNGREHHNRKYVSYRIPALLHTCQQSRAVGLKKYPACFEKQLNMPVLFNLSKDLLLFINDSRFLRCLRRSLKMFGVNDNGVPDELRFRGICSALDFQPGLYYDSTYYRLRLFYNLEELILKRCKAFPHKEWQATFVDNLEKTWRDRREEAAQELKGPVSAHESKLLKISLLSSEELKRLANGEHLTRL